MKKEIFISVNNIENRVHYNDLKDFQGDLKTISDVNLTKLKRAIRRVGFTVPFMVWNNSDSYFILDGHQRKAALTSLDHDGFSIPPVPIIEIKADSIEKAREILIYTTSQYGEFNPEVASEWINGLDEAVSSLVRIVDNELALDLSALNFDLPTEPKNDSGVSEKECPECGCKF